MKPVFRVMAVFFTVYLLSCLSVRADIPQTPLKRYYELKNELDRAGLMKNTPENQMRFSQLKKQLSIMKNELRKMTFKQEKLKSNITNRALNNRFELLSLSIYSTSIGSYRIVGHVRNISDGYYDFVKLNYEFYKDGSLVLSDYGYIDFESYGYAGMLPYSQSFWVDYVDEVDYDDLKITIEYRTENGNDDIFYDQILIQTENEIKEDIYSSQWNGLIQNQSGNDVKFAKIYACFLKDKKIIDYDYTYVDFRYPAYVQIYSIITFNEGGEEINLYNYSDQDINLSDWTLGDKDNSDSYRIPDGTSIETKSYYEFAQDDLNFTINKANQVIYLKNNSGQLIDQWSLEDEYKLKGGETWGYNSYISIPRDYDEIVYYPHYALYSLEGNANINPNIPLFTQDSFEVSQSVENSYSVFLIDGDNDPVQFKIDWGDGNISSFTGNHNSKSTGTLTYSYAAPGKYYIRAQATDQKSLNKISAASAWSDSVLVIVNEQINSQPEFSGNYFSFGINQVYPNPFSNRVTISFTLSCPGEAALEIYNATGQKARSLSLGYRSAGQHHVSWNGTDNHRNLLASGIYFCVIRSGDQLDCSRALFLR